MPYHVAEWSYHIILCNHYVGSAELSSQLDDIAEEDLEKLVVVQPTKAGMEPDFLRLVQRLGQVRLINNKVFQ